MSDIKLQVGRSRRRPGFDRALSDFFSHQQARVRELLHPTPAQLASLAPDTVVIRDGIGSRRIDLTEDDL